MSTNTKKISVKKRDKKEKGSDEYIPAVLYGPKTENALFSINKKEFAKLYKSAGESTLITLEVEESKERPLVLIYEVQKDPFKKDIIHVDFFKPNLKEEVEAEIPLVFIGESPAVKDLDGTLVKNMYSVNVKALPQNLPHEIEVDISALKTFDDAIYVKDLSVPENVTITQDSEWAVAMISTPENVEEELEKPIEDGEEVEVIGEKEKEEEAQEEEEKKEEKNEKEDNKEPKEEQK